MIILLPDKKEKEKKHRCEIDVNNFTYEVFVESTCVTDQRKVTNGALLTTIGFDNDGRFNPS